jgi:hypothetical protein
MTRGSLVRPLRTGIFGKPRLKKVNSPFGSAIPLELRPPTPTAPFPLRGSATPTSQFVQISCFGSGPHPPHPRVGEGSCWVTATRCPKTWPGHLGGRLTVHIPSSNTSHTVYHSFSSQTKKNFFLRKKINVLLLACNFRGGGQRRWYYTVLGPGVHTSDNLPK